MVKTNDFLFGLALGAGLMYLLDPDRGQHRRALLRDRLGRAGRGLEQLGEDVAAQARNLRGQTDEKRAETRLPLTREQVDDVTLTARVRAALGRYVSNPGALGVSSDHGRITLTGTVRAREVDTLIDGVESIRGVADVINRLQVHQQPDDVPGRQGSGF